MPKNDGVFKVQFQNTNLGLKLPKWVTKMSNKNSKISNMLLNICCQKNWRIICQNIFFSIFTPTKNASIKDFMKLTPANKTFSPFLRVF